MTDAAADGLRATTPVIDYALTRPEIAADQISLFGYSLGGYLVARAAAFEKRIAALILDDGIFDFHAAMVHAMPPFLNDWIEQDRDDAALPVIALMMSRNTQFRWAIRNGMWSMGVASPADVPPRSRLIPWPASLTRSPRPHCFSTRTTANFFEASLNAPPRRSETPRWSPCPPAKARASIATWAQCLGCTKSFSIGWRKRCRRRDRPAAASGDPWK